MQKRKKPTLSLSDEQLEAIADRAVEKLDARIGKTVRTRALWILGLAVSALISLAAGAMFSR